MHKTIALQLENLKKETKNGMKIAVLYMNKILLYGSVRLFRISTLLRY